MSVTPFWMVTRKPPKGVPGQKFAQGAGPRMRHYSLARASGEAQRLATLTGETFVVLGIVEVVEPPRGEASAPTPEQAVAAPFKALMQPMLDAADGGEE